LCPLTDKSDTFEKTLLSLFTGSILFAACKKTDYMLNIPVAKQECELQTANPSGKSYASDSVVTYNCTTIIAV
jgi:hypothetical protein